MPITLSEYYKVYGNDIALRDQESNFSIDDVESALHEIVINKVDKIIGKQLSSNDFTTVEKNKLTQSMKTLINISTQ